LKGESPPTPQTPSSAINRNVTSVSASALGRRSLGLGGSPGASPLGRSMSAGGDGKASPKGDELQGALLAYEARHSPTTSEPLL